MIFSFPNLSSFSLWFLKWTLHWKVIAKTVWDFCSANSVVSRKLWALTCSLAVLPFCNFYQCNVKEILRKTMSVNVSAAADTMGRGDGRWSDSGVSLFWTSDRSFTLFYLLNASPDNLHLQQTVPPTFKFERKPSPAIGEVRPTLSIHWLYRLNWDDCLQRTIYLQITFLIHVVESKTSLQNLRNHKSQQNLPSS